jgi:pyruvyltransferase
MRQIKVYARPPGLLTGEVRINFGDNLMRPLLNELFGVDLVYVPYEQAELIGVGSILDLHYRQSRKRKRPQRWDFREIVTGLMRRRGELHVWGSGFMESHTQALWPQRVFFHSVRGPLSRDRIGASKIALGDPGLLLPLIWPKPATAGAAVAIIPHCATYRTFLDLFGDRLPRHWHVIDLLDPPESVARAIAASEFVVSSSLHGLIVADAYGVPNCSMVPHGRLSGDGFKFADYAAFRGAPLQTPLSFEAVLEKHAELSGDPACAPRIPNATALAELRQAFPFR